ncbi:type II secretion system protein, partial [Candidatus Shapirobacteria bacterium]|nr:type II secretion system protein [Candidatus Shapirobacteria bacterium]
MKSCMHHSQTKERVGFHPHLLKLSKGEGFTLLELLIVIAILAILSGVTLIVLNPSELLKRTRDSRRLSDLATINRALGYYQTEGGTQMGSSSVVYVSLPDTSPTCGSYTLPPLPSGWSYKCV